MNPGVDAGIAGSGPASAAQPQTRPTNRRSISARSPVAVSRQSGGGDQPSASRPDGGGNVGAARAPPHAAIIAAQNTA